MTQPALLVQGLVRRFGRAIALHGIDLVVPQGAFVVLLGAAGAGKTTTLRAIAGLDPPDAGRIAIAGHDVTHRAPKHRDVAMIFDNLALYPERTGFGNIGHPLEVRGMPREVREARVRETAATLRIPHVLARLPRTMSGGERQRVALARALVRDPKLFLLDEPLSSLDALLRIELRAELKRLQRDRGASFLLATPDHVEAMALADTVVVLVQGRVRQVAAPQALYDDPADADVARFVGAPEINLFGAQYDTQEGARMRLLDTVMPAPAALRHVFNQASTCFQIGLRPEHVRLGPLQAGGVAATVLDIEPLGLDAAVTCIAAGTAIRATLPNAEARGLAQGQAVGLAFAPQHLLAFDQTTGQRVA